MNETIKLIKLLIVLALAPIAVAEASNVYQKPGAAIRIINNDIITLKANEQRTVELNFNVPANTRIVKLSLNKPKGLNVLNDVRQWSFSGENIAPKVMLSISGGNIAGHYSLSFTAQLWQADNANWATDKVQAYTPSASRVLGVGVVVGDVERGLGLSKTSPTPSSIRTLSNGERVHWLTAESE